MLLAIDTSTTQTGLACYDTNGMLGECVWHSGRDHTAQLGETLVANLEARYQDVRNRSLTFRNATEAQLEAMRQSAMDQASATSAKSAEMAKDTARQMWEKSEPLRQGAQEVGKGLVRAWSELATSFGKAAEKIQSERDKAAAGEEHKTS